MTTKLRHRAAATALPVILAATAAVGEEAAVAAADPHSDRMIAYISVIGTAAKQKEIPGSAQLIDKLQLEKFEYEDIHRILRQVPGVIIQEEEGFGLRPNIGIRGTGTERSEKITLMEDGVLIAPAPYAAPAAYYFPTSARMSAVEVRKGSSAIKFGPRTVGGAVNLVSTGIPDELSGHTDVRLGSDSLYQIHGYAGGSTDHLGAIFETYQSGSDGFKKLDTGSETGYELEDYLAKFRVSSAKDADLYQSFELKLSYTDQQSDETYLGLTDADFSATPYRRYAASALDNIDTEHWQAQGTHFISFNDTVDLTTVAYYNRFKRAWYKLNDLNPGGGTVSLSSVLDNPAANATAIGILRGDIDSAANALRVRNNNREYYAQGIQSIAGVHFNTGAARHDLEISVRYHEDEEDRFQNDDRYQMLNGTMVLTSAGAPGSQENRVGQAQAWAFYVQDEMRLGDWLIVPGLRYEDIDLKRLNYSTADPARAAGPTSVNKSSIKVLIPGIGVTYSVNERVNLIAGVHRGFSPPGPGSAEAKEEKSTNWEAGVRYNNRTLALEAIGFYSDYSNILGTCTNASGCNQGEIGDQFNGGAVKVIGMEVAASADLGAELEWDVSLPVSLTYTFTDAEFKTSFVSGYWGTVTDGDNLPYLPKHQLNAVIGVAKDAWGIDLSMNYISAIRTEPGQGAIAAAEKINGRAVFDIAGRYQISDSVRLFGSVQNLTDKEYAVARRPAGLRPGKPRTVVAGVAVDF